MRPLRARLWLAACGTLAACAACGFKGPLYLPGRHVAVVTHAAPAPPGSVTQAPAAEKKKSGTPPPAASPPPSPPR